jgi:hypothetical protein
MTQGSNVGPLKFFSVVFHYTEETTAEGVILALDKEDATKRLFNSLGPQVTNLVVSSVTEIPQEGEIPVYLDNLTEGTPLLKH